MEKIYRTYKDITEFRIVYINEAHAADGDRPVPYAEELGLFEHLNLDDRCISAEKMLADEGVTIPCVVDNMDNAANKAYSAWPDRIFVIAPDGKLAVASDRGPWGFKPGLKELSDWLAAYREPRKDGEINAD